MKLKQKAQAQQQPGTTMTAARSSNDASIFAKAFKDIQEKRAGLPEAIPLPDEDELERVRRKRAAKRSGGRSSTILSDDNRVGG